MIFQKMRIEDWCKAHPEVIITFTDNRRTTAEVEGTLELRPSDLKNGELPFKIERLSGDLILYCRRFKPSVIPAQLGGDIIFRNRMLGENVVATKFNVGDVICYLDKNKPVHGTVKRVIIRSSYKDDWSVGTSVTYQVGLAESCRVEEPHAFGSIDEMRISLLAAGCAPAPAGLVFSTKYAPGDEVWLVDEGKTQQKTVWGMKIEVDDGESRNNRVLYSVTPGVEPSLEEMWLHDSLQALVANL